MKVNYKLISFYLLCFCVFMTGGVLIAGNITNSSAPTATMYTIRDIYNLIHNNTLATPGNHSLSRQTLHLLALLPIRFLKSTPTSPI